jgi:nucleoside-diphosphate-sugar epimerase
MKAAKPVVLITGSSGFLGSAVIKKLAGQFDLVGLDRESSPHPPAAAECVCVDLTSDASIEAGMERIRLAHGDRIASVIHLAAYFDLSGEPDPRYEEVTVRGTERLLAALESFTVEQFVFVSTMLVHAPT